MRESTIRRDTMGPSQFPAALRSALFLALALASCSAHPPPVPVQGTDADVERLAGRWAGSYESSATGRHGSILFQLESARDTAYGDVLMLPPDRPLTYRLDPDGVELRESPSPAPAVLPIRFVGVAGGRVFGVLDAYTDPDCGCRLRTTFGGRLVGDEVEGTYRTEHVDTGRIVEGHWQVRRLND